jgi:dolichyl-phosphate-mannose--protein O-mannosyl transferase
MFDRLHHGTDESAQTPAGYTAPPFASPAWKWPLLLQPIRYYQDAASGAEREILALGNPAVWWGFLAALPVLLVAAARRRDFASRVVLGGFAAAWLPWLLVGRPTYSYYLVAGVPFMALGLSTTMALAPDRFRRRYLLSAGALVVVVALAFVPLWIGGPLPPWHDQLRWLSSWR